MKKWLEQIKFGEKEAVCIVDRELYSMGLFILVLSGFSFQLPLTLNVFIQFCFLICTAHVTYRYIKDSQYLMALLKIGMIVVVAVFLIDDIYFRIFLSQ